METVISSIRSIVPLAGLVRDIRRLGVLVFEGKTFKNVSLHKDQVVRKRANILKDDSTGKILFGLNRRTPTIDTRDEIIFPFSGLGVEAIPLPLVLNKETKMLEAIEMINIRAGGRIFIRDSQKELFWDIIRNRRELEFTYDQERYLILKEKL